MATLVQVEKQIFEREGFRVKLVPLTAKTKSIPAYDFTAMAPQRWRISDWKMQRLDAYVTFLRGVVVFRGDGTEAQRDLQLGNLRDTYYEAAYGPSKRAALERDNVVDLSSRRR